MEHIVHKEIDGLDTLIVIPPVVDDMATTLRHLLDKLREAGKKMIVLDLEGIDHLRTPFLGAIVFGHRKMAKSGGSLSLTHVSEELRKLLETFSLDSVIDIH